QGRDELVVDAVVVGPRRPARAAKSEIGRPRRVTPERPPASRTRSPADRIESSRVEHEFSGRAHEPETAHERLIPRELHHAAGDPVLELDETVRLDAGRLAVV